MMKQKKTESTSLKHKARGGCFRASAIILGLFLGWCTFIFGGLLLAIADFVNPVTRIEYVLRTEFSADVQVLEAEYNRYGWDDQFDSFSIALAMLPSLAENFILEQCNSPLETLPTMYLSHTTYEYVVDGQNSCGTGFWVVFSVDTSNSELYRIDIYGEPECYSKNPFSAALPCRK
jgi:hypothetical protein